MGSKGFTLIELLVVIAIIGIIAAIALPAFNAYRERAWDSEVMTIARTFYNAEEAYYTDNELYYDCTVAASGSSTCGALPGVGALGLNETTVVNMALPQGLLVLACRDKAPHAYAYITDPTFEHYSGGGLDEINRDGMNCADFISSALGGS